MKALINKTYPVNRKVVLDLETTGKFVNRGDRIVSIGMVELLNDLPTNNFYYAEFNPQRDLDDEVVAIHGLTSEYLRDKPLFSFLAEEIVAFIGNSKLVIHNVNFDLLFLKAELEKSGYDVRDFASSYICTVELARNILPLSKVNLDSLCDYFNVSTLGRRLHNALEDARLLSQIYYFLDKVNSRSKGSPLMERLMAKDLRDTKDLFAERAFKIPAKLLKSLLEA